MIQKDTILKDAKPIKRYWKIGILLLFILILFLLGLPWLAIGLVFLFFLYKGTLYSINTLKNKMFRRLCKGIFLFLFIFTISISLKVFVLDIYRIPSGSMEDTLLPGDVILLDKLIYGPKLPRNPFEISWINLLFYLNDRARASMDKNWWPYKRLSGCGKIAQGDVLVYQLSRTFFVVKRCVAVAGDTLRVDKGEVFTNNNQFYSPPTIRENYLLAINNRRKFYKELDSLQISASLHPTRTKPITLRGNLTKYQEKRLSLLHSVKTIKKDLDTFSIKRGLFAIPKTEKWTLDHLGPFIIPFKGMHISLNNWTYAIYGKVLRKHEGLSLKETNGSFYDQNGTKVNTFIFKHDYYFVMGDNRKNSMDSRYIGFVPKKNIIGKVYFVLFSNYLEEFQWNRFLKKLS